MERFCSLKKNIFLLQKMKLFILLLFGPYAVGFEITICNCPTPIRQEHLRIDDDHCQPILRPTQHKANYAVWTDRQDGLKVRAYICSRWEKINHVTTNVFFQKIVVPDKRAIDTTQDECTLMAKTKRCDEMPMYLSRQKRAHGYVQYHRRYSIAW